ncbi:uncharacterized protein [Henckelia pumila]|uniref:uncharacterized protein n=1 Tax=Henckelia pumila TaxID=405737 RepID=UPI003C6E581C
MSSDSSKTDENSEKSPATLAPLSGSDNSSLQISAHKLNGHNYLQWAQSVKIVICDRGKMGYLTGELESPKKSDPSYKTWVAKNFIVLAWLINSMENNISRRYLWFQTTKEGSNSVTQYFTDLQDLWQELDLFLDNTPTCADCSVKVRQNLEKECVFDFLAGLNRELDDVRGRVVAREPFPSLEDAFADVRREEMRRKVMLPTSLPAASSAPEVFALISNKFNSPGQRQGKRPWCEHCKRPGHTKDKCWEIYGKLVDWQPRKQPQGRGFQTQIAQEQPASSDITAPFTKEQIEQIEQYCRLLRQSSLNPSPNPTVDYCSITQSGNIQSAINSCVAESWIVDSGASDHMTGNSTLFSSYIPCTSRTTVRITDGSLTHVMGLGNIQLSKDIILKSVFYVPSLKCNMISELPSGKTIGSARIHHGLYYFENASSVPRQSLLSSVRYAPVILLLKKVTDVIVLKTRKMYVSCDVTFLETTPFFSLSLLQGEISHEACWDTTHLLGVQVDPLFFSCPDSSTTNTRVHDTTTPHVPVPETKTKTESAPHKELYVYSRRNKSQVTKDVVNLSHSQENEPMVDSSLSGTTHDLDVPIAFRKGVRSCNKHPIFNFVSYSNLSSSFRVFTSTLSSVIIPRSIQEALNVPEWKAAVLEEIRALQQNNTWSLVQLPQGKNTAGSRWVFTVKYKADGSIERHKARLVAKGFTQTYGIDYTETFALVAKLNTFRILLSLAANLDWPLHQLDIKNAFLNGDLEEEVYMSQPHGFEENVESQIVCKLHKSLYGLKKSPVLGLTDSPKLLKSSATVRDKQTIHYSLNTPRTGK